MSSRYASAQQLRIFNGGDQNLPPSHIHPFIPTLLCSITLSYPLIHTPHIHTYIHTYIHTLSRSLTTPLSPVELLGVAIGPSCVPAGAVPDIEALLLHGQLLLSQGSYSLARDSFRRAVGVSPWSPVALASLAMAVAALQRSTGGGSGGGGGGNHTINHLLQSDVNDDEDNDEDEMASSLSAGIQVWLEG